MKRKMLYLAVLSALTLTSCALSFGTTSTDDSSTGSSDTSGDSTSSDTGADTSSGTSSGTSGNTSSDTSSNTSAETSSSTSTVAEGWDNYFKPDIVDEYHSYQDLQKNIYLNSIPSQGEDIDILVVPVEFTDYPFAAKTLTDLEILFNGTSSQTNYWESVASFYEKSSYGHLDFDFTIAATFDTEKTVSQFVSTYGSFFTTKLVRNVVSDYKTANGNSSTQQFDNDSDGFIDAVWMIYSCPNYSNSDYIANISENFWAYVTWDAQQSYNGSGSVSSPVANVYGWASYDFMYEGGGDTKIDAHTYIHETGHLLGLDDYYNYDEDSTYKPLGAIDMMDYNIIDHNAWSKMALGWLKPYVVTGDAEIIINPVESSGDAILIADNWNGTSFDEFILLELYTPTGLNKLDSRTNYVGRYPRAYTTAGVRLLHIDARLGIFNYSNQFINYGDPGSGPLYNDSTQRYFAMANSNTPSYSADENHRLVHMIQALGTNTFDEGMSGTNSDLFKTGQTFSMSTHGTEFFKNGNKLNNGNALGYAIYFSSVSSESATIRIEKI
ncbi:MAG TPA: hypothetical protein PLU89_01560 [Bacilli bacterium]|nr:hypothetical protein [Bacilli bacterium]